MVSSVCKAKDPRTCPYHGAVIRMNEAMFETPPNFNKYYEARQEVEAQERKGWSEAELKEALQIPEEQKQPQFFEEKSNIILDDRSPAAQQGVLLDQIGVRLYAEEITVFTLHKKDDYTTAPSTPYYIRIQADQPLTPQEVTHLAQLMGYAYRSTIAGESLGTPLQDTPYSFVVSADTTKTSRDDLGMALDDFEEKYPQIVKTGSPLRKTDRAGAGTKNTRLIEPFTKPIELNFYYDE